MPQSASVWIRCDNELPPEGEEVMTKIDDTDSCRNTQALKRHRGLWFFPDMSMYVYYRPTHWCRVSEYKRVESGKP